MNHYRWWEGNTGILSPSHSVFSPSTPSSAYSRMRKRLRRAEIIKSLASADSPNCGPAHKRRSSVSEAYLLSTSGSFLDSTDKTLLSPETVVMAADTASSTKGSTESDETPSVSSLEAKTNFDFKTATPRQQVD